MRSSRARGLPLLLTASLLSIFPETVWTDDIDVFKNYDVCTTKLAAGGADPFGTHGISSSLASVFNSSYNFNVDVGDQAPDFQVMSVETGNFTTMQSLLNETVVVIVYGMLSDPYARYSTDGGFFAE